MNNASGSIVRKLGFALALVIAAALGYFVVRHRLRLDQERADLSAAAASPAPGAPVAAGPVTSPSKPNYLPLRGRVETNVVRVATNRLLVISPPADRSREIPVATETVATKTLMYDARPSGGALVGDRQSARNNFSVNGRVILRGTPPPEKSTLADPACGTLRTTPLVTSRHYVVSSDGGLANTFVYIKAGAPGWARQQGADARPGRLRIPALRHRRANRANVPGEEFRRHFS